MYEEKRLLKQNIRRIYRQVKAMEKRGYRFTRDDSLIKGRKELVKILPKEVLTDLEYAQTIKPKDLYFRSTYTTDSGRFRGIYGKKIEQQERRAIKRSTSKAPIDETRSRLDYEYADDVSSLYETNVIDYLSDSLENWRPIGVWSNWYAARRVQYINRLQAALNAAINRSGEKVIAKRLQQNADRVNTLVDKLIYSDSGSIGTDGQSPLDPDLTELVNIINGETMDMESAAAIGDIFEDEGEDE